MIISATNQHIDEGYIKYNCEWQISPPPSPSLISNLNHWRKHVYTLKWIGYDANLKVGYGNISVRHPQQPKQFIISGTQTGHLSTLNNEHYSLVSSFDIRQNTLKCEGAIKASSESLTHAIIYLLDKNNQAVIHIHHRQLWEQYKNKLPTTASTVPYGTPEMAYEIAHLYHTSDLAQQKVLIMAGHQDGIISFGKDLAEAMMVLLKLELLST